MRRQHNKGTQEKNKGSHLISVLRGGSVLGEELKNRKGIYRFLANILKSTICVLRRGEI